MDIPDKPPAESEFIELSGNYEYLTEGYYRCQDAELRGYASVVPRCSDALDAYIVPIALEKAHLAGIPIPEWYLTNEYFLPPAVVYGVNPFTRKYAVVFTEDERDRAAKQLTWNFKYSICCQRISSGVEIVEFAMVDGRTARPEMEVMARRVREVFNLPMCNVRVLKTGSIIQLSAIELLPIRMLTPQERTWLNELKARMAVNG
ncbi:MAG: hypothetical protein Kow0074_16120 [Candidatus Zixiibacteriota bacterium]